MPVTPLIDLAEKYNVPVPRYTSYPTVPHWNTDAFDRDAYLNRFTAGLASANADGLSLYVHLPYCESLCTYCGCNTRITVNHAVEQPYIDSLVREWHMYRALFTAQGLKPRIREIHFGGGTPTFFSAANLARLAQALCDGSDIVPGSSFGFEAHPASTTTAHLEVLRTLGFDRLSLGVQDFDPVVQRAINRRQTPGDVERVVREARALGYSSINFDLVYGLPFQTLEGVQNAVEQVVHMRPDRIAFYSYAHVPWMRPGQRAYSETDLPDATIKLRLFTTGRDMLHRAGYESIGFDHFALPTDSLYEAYRQGTVHRNFMGYTHLRTAYLVGLGVSSISDIGVAFAQNAKGVEAWRERVESGEWPIVKGHLLNEQEVYVRKHILKLTCTQRTSWADAPAHEQDYMRGRAAALQPFIQDGLCTRTGYSVTLTELGRSFSRNVCSAFDMYYTLIKEGKMFSGGV